MGRHIVGTEGFVYKFAIGRRAIDLELMTRATDGVGELYFVSEYLVTFQDGSTETLAPDELADDLDDDDDEGDDDEALEEAGVHQVPDDVDSEAFIRTLCEAERDRVEDIKDHFEGREPARIELVANAQYRLYDWEWEEMLTWVNARLPEELKLTMDALGELDLEALARFNPERDRPSQKAGTLHYAHLFKSEADGLLPCLALRILVHAVQNELERMDVDDEPRVRGPIWSST